MKTKTHRYGVALSFGSALAVLMLASAPAHAAVISWNGTTVTHMVNNGVAADNYAQLITGDYQEAAHYFADRDDVAGSLTVFDGSRNLLFNELSGTQIDGTGLFGANAANTGDADFNNILRGGRNHGPQTLTLGNVNALEIGKTYSLQIWFHSANAEVLLKGDEATATGFTGQVSGGANGSTGNSITDTPWYVTATFTADAATQTVTMTSNPGGTSGSVGFDAYLVTVPEPSAALLGGLGALLLLRRRR